jgi:hypothetical protein
MSEVSSICSEDPVGATCSHWSLVLSGLTDLARFRTPAARSVRVALIDGRVMQEHPVFGHARIEISESDRLSWDADADPHATFLASMLVGSGSSALGLCPNCTIVNIPICDSAFRRGGLPLAEAARRVCGAIGQAVSARVDVIQLSLEFSEALTPPFRRVAELIDEAALRGIRTVIAAGNTPALTTNPMCSRPGAIPVVATDRWGDVRRGSPMSPILARRGLRAPGEDLPGATAPEGYTRGAGSSCATAFVTAAFVLLLGWFESRGPNAIWEALLDPEGGPRRPSMVPPLLDAQGAAKRLARSVT